MCLNDDISWHVHGSEENSFARDMLAYGHLLLFGRLLARRRLAFWPTPMEMKNMKEMAKGVNDVEK